MSRNGKETRQRRELKFEVTLLGASFTTYQSTKSQPPDATPGLAVAMKNKSEISMTRRFPLMLLGVLFLVPSVANAQISVAASAWYNTLRIGTVPPQSGDMSNGGRSFSRERPRVGGATLLGRDHLHAATGHARRARDRPDHLLCQGWFSRRGVLRLARGRTIVLADRRPDRPLQLATALHGHHPDRSRGRPDAFSDRCGRKPGCRPATAPVHLVQQQLRPRFPGDGAPQHRSQPESRQLDHRRHPDSERLRPRRDVPCRRAGGAGPVGGRRRLAGQTEYGPQSQATVDVSWESSRQSQA